VKSLLTATAAIEAAAGLALLAGPSVTASLLLGPPLEAPAPMTLARVGGAAILALAIVCWLTRDAPSLVLRGLVIAMMFYNTVVAAVLAFASFGYGLHGELLWPAVAFHVAMDGWCIATLLRNENGALR
jgi:hypothetical protein